MQNETRTTPRRQAFLPAKIFFNDKQSVFDCLIRNISAKGACLKVVSRLGIPNQFTLFIPGENKQYSCWLVWSGMKEIGVSFSEEHSLHGQPDLQIVKPK